MSTSKTQQGYSMIELVIYIALFALLSIVLVQSLITVMKTYASSTRYRVLQNNGELVMERITRELRNGTTATASSCASSVGTLSVASIDTDTMQHTTTFAVVEGVVQLTTDSGAPQAISTNEVSATLLNFCRISTGTGTAIKVTLTLTTMGPNSFPASFYSTIVLRGQ